MQSASESATGWPMSGGNGDETVPRLTIRLIMAAMAVPPVFFWIAQRRSDETVFLGTVTRIDNMGAPQSIHSYGGS